MTATITVLSPAGATYNTLTPFDHLANIGATTARTTTSFTAEATGGVTFNFVGTGFRYNAAGDLVAGAITSYTLIQGGESILTSSFAPRLSAIRLWQAINASEFEPLFGLLPVILIGGDGADILVGQDANDLVEGNGGADTLDGGDNLGAGDTLTYASSGAGVDVSFIRVGPQSGGEAAGDTIANFENLIGSASGDFLTGDGDANIIDGRDGDDTIDGHDGNDRLIGGLGSDTVSYISVSDAVTVSLAKLGNQQTGGGDIDRLTGFENLTGSAFDDLLTGNNFVNTIHGDEGDDTIEGGRAADFLFGDGNTSDGDSVSYAHSAQAVIVDLNIAVQALTLGVAANGDASGDTLSGFENIIGSGRSDFLIGDAGSNTLSGGMGRDTLTGNAGEDVFHFNRLVEKGDHITDFVSLEDSLEFAAAGFKNAIPGDVNLVVGTGTGLVSAAREATFLYDTANGNLYYDMDGTGAAAKQLMVTLDNVPLSLSALDILIV